MCHLRYQKTVKILNLNLNNDNEIILEFGGGTGQMSDVLSKLNFKGKHIVYELPLITIIQRHFINKRNIKTKYILDDEKLDIINGTNFLPCNQINTEKFVMNLQNINFIATFSLTETDIDTHNKFAKFITNFSRVYIAYSLNKTVTEDYIDNIAKIIAGAPDKIKVLQSPIHGIRGSLKNPMGELKHTYKSMQELKELLFVKCPVTTPTVVYKKQLYDDGIVRWDSKNYLGAVDYELYFNIVDNDIFIYPYPQWLGYYYRWHKAQATWGMHKETVNYDEKIKQYWRTKWNLN